MNVITRDGCRIAYCLEGSGPPVFMIQGVGLPGEGWRPQVQGLLSHFACLTFDNRGTGGSDATPPYRVEQMAEDAGAVLDAIGWTSAHIVGHSMGGLIAQQLAITQPHRVRSLALLCTFANGRHAAPLTPRMMWLGARTQLGTRRMRRHAFLQLIYSPGGFATTNRDQVAADLAPLFGHDLGVQPPTVNAQLKAMRAFNATSQLAKLGSVPTLVLAAGHDPIAPPFLGRALADAIPGARFVSWPDASHGAPIEFGKRMNALLRDHLAAAETAFQAAQRDDSR